jgi:hypothetical protein
MALLLHTITVLFQLHDVSKVESMRAVRDDIRRKRAARFWVGIVPGV